MMDVMNANIGGKPAHDARQIEIRAAMKRRLVQAPDADGEFTPVEGRDRHQGDVILLKGGEVSMVLVKPVAT